MAKIIVYVIMVACCSCVATSTPAQFYFYNDGRYEPTTTWEAGGSAGGMNCLTDLGGKAGAGKRLLRDINWVNSRLCGSWHVSALYRSVIGARAELAFGQVAAFDSILPGNDPASYGRRLRNLSFRSDITEATLTVILYPMALFTGNGEAPPRLCAYLVAGIGYFAFNPQARINNSWVTLQPLRTEGQGFVPGRKPYRLSGFNLPAGIGITCEAAAIFNMHAEVVCRKLWTDYLDDVSTTYADPAAFYRNLPPAKASLAARMASRSIHPNATQPGSIRGNPHNNDAYFSFTLKAGLVLGRQKVRAF